MAAGEEQLGSGVASHVPQSGGDYLVAPVRLAAVHLNKPRDVAILCQLALATGHAEISFVGDDTLAADHPKVHQILSSWHVTDPRHLLKERTAVYPGGIGELRAASGDARLIGTVVNGGRNAFRFDWRPDDVVVMGGANGLSQKDVAMMDDTVTIPTAAEVPFYTTPVVASALTYHILGKRGLWSIVAPGTYNL
ncbi:MAG TPA: hypothetical protein VGS28_03010 [Candidatus Saccharimonadales bacterium]|nr:hypothetical protein [Candidatus Saccharimonadales bacterium]